jgi:hypothetical protein
VKYDIDNRPQTNPASAFRVEDFDGSLEELQNKLAEWGDKLRGKLWIYDTGNLNKFQKHEELFNLYDFKKDNQSDGNSFHGGLNAHIMHGGRVDVIPGNTPEMHGTTAANGFEKAQKQFNKYWGVVKNEDGEQITLLHSITKNILRKPGDDNEKQEFDPRTIDVIGVTEDSEWHLVFKNEPDKEQKFLTSIIDILENGKEAESVREMDNSERFDRYKLPKENLYILKNLRQNGKFPGADLKPIMQAVGGFDHLMTLIYDIAQQVGLEELHYGSSTTTTFTEFATGEMLQKSFTAYGKLLDKTGYLEKKDALKPGQALYSDYVMIPDGQAEGAKLTLFELLEQGLATTPSDKMPASYERRMLVEWLHGGPAQRISDDVSTPGASASATPTLNIGGRAASTFARKWEIQVAHATKDWYESGTDLSTIPKLRDGKDVTLPKRKELLKYPSMSELGVADLVVLHHSGTTQEEIDNTNYDPDLGFLYHLIVTMETEGRSMDRKIILNNTGGQWDKQLEILTDAIVKGRAMGPLPFVIANSTQELNDLEAQKRQELYDKHKAGIEGENIIQKAFDEIYETAGQHRLERQEAEHKILIEKMERAKQIIQRTPQLKTKFTLDPYREDADMPASLPEDGTPTILLCGGHGNNNASDLQQAHDFGYRCAANDWRIVTGGGILEGAMGATHTGFIQYHLDQMDIDTIFSEAGSHLPQKYQNAKALKQQLLENGSLEKTSKSLKFNAHNLIKKHPELVNHWAEHGMEGEKETFIPKKMFWAYSTQDLLDLEGSGEPTPGVTYCPSGTRQRRIGRIMEAGHKMFHSGAYGTDEELLEAIRLQGEARNADRRTDEDKAKQYHVDGTPDDEGKIYIVNDGRWNVLLEHLNLIPSQATLDAVDTKPERDKIREQYKEAAKEKGIFIAKKDLDFVDLLEKHSSKWRTQYGGKDQSTQSIAM